ncbi:MAG: hypothetical protein E7658_03120 [Ruminococcaceae bacterium]|nr:hypothetical protein [Oscillospiraceae bacterium]
MKKKFICILLSMLMLSNMLLTGCALFGRDDENLEADIEESERGVMTLTLWLPTSENTTDEALALVEEAINNITRAKFETAIELHAVAQDEYQKALDARMNEINEMLGGVMPETEAREEEAEETEAAADGETAAEETAAEGTEETAGETAEETAEETEVEETEYVEETYVNEIGVTVIKYPEPAPEQLDIFLIQGYDKYMEYIEGGLLQALDDEIDTTSKALKSHIYPTFLEGADKDGIYAIPNNRPIDDYKFLLINKELVDKYDYDIDKLNTMSDCEIFIKDMGMQNLEGVVPLLDTYEMAGVNYLSVDGAWSVAASYFSNDLKPADKVDPVLIFNIPGYIDNIRMMKELSELGYVGDGTLEEGEKFAVGVVTGDPNTIAEYGEEYYIKVFERPIADREDVYSNMFGVSVYSRNLARSMEIITLLNTNKELRTILQYGVEGVHWQVNADDDSIIDIISDDYQMDINATGNVFMTYPGEGRSMDEWEFYKEQNLASLVSPYFNFDMLYDSVNQNKLRNSAGVSGDTLEKIQALNSKEFLEQIDSIALTANGKFVISVILSTLEGASTIATDYFTFWSEEFPEEFKIYEAESIAESEAASIAESESLAAAEAAAAETVDPEAETAA